MSEQTLYYRIYSDFLDQIRCGALARGTKLPTEKEISQNYGVSRITSKRAMELLRDEGYISRTPGRGSFVTFAEDTEPLDGTPRIRATQGTIGLIIPDFSESYGMEIVTGVERGARDHGYNLMLRRSMFASNQEDESIDALHRAGCEGLILMPQHNDFFNDHILRLILDDFPVVIIDREMPGIDTTFIATKNRQSSLDATNQLLDLGHTEIIFLSYPTKNASTLQERMSGFRQAFYNHKRLWNEQLLLTHIVDSADDRTYASRAAADKETIKAFIAAHPEATAIFATEYNFAQLALQALEELGLKVPEQFSLIGYDGPSSTTGNAFMSRIIQPQEDMGWLAVNALVEKIAGEAHTGSIKLDATFFPGASIGPVPQ